MGKGGSIPGPRCRLNASVIEPTVIRVKQISKSGAEDVARLPWGLATAGILAGGRQAGIRRFVRQYSGSPAGAQT